MPQNLFTSQTPTNTNADNANPLHVGTYLSFSENGTVSKIRFYFPTTPQSGVKAALIRTSDSVKVGADVTFSGSPAAGWSEVSFPSPVSVTSATQYAAVVRVPRYYVATTGASSPWPLTNNKISTPSGAGRFNDDDSTDVQMVSTAFSNGCYFVDVEYTAESDVVTPSVTPDGIAVPVDFGEPTVRMVATPNGIAVPVTFGSPIIVSQVPYRPEAGSGGWRSLVNIMTEQRENERADTESRTRPLACPHDGEPLQFDPAGHLHCRFDGYTVR